MISDSHVEGRSQTKIIKCGKGSLVAKRLSRVVRNLWLLVSERPNESGNDVRIAETNIDEAETSSE
jgi:hypothetical protein